jgi:hypothetical protein
MADRGGVSRSAQNAQADRNSRNISIVYWTEACVYSRLFLTCLMDAYPSAGFLPNMDEVEQCVCDDDIPHG